MKKLQTLPSSSYLFLTLGLFITFSGTRSNQAMAMAEGKWAQDPTGRIACTYLDAKTGAPIQKPLINPGLFESRLMPSTVFSMTAFSLKSFLKKFPNCAGDTRLTLLINPADQQLQCVLSNGTDPLANSAKMIVLKNLPKKYCQSADEIFPIVNFTEVFSCPDLDKNKGQDQSHHFSSLQPLIRFLTSNSQFQKEVDHLFLTSLASPESPPLISLPFTNFMHQLIESKVTSTEAPLAASLFFAIIDIEKQIQELKQRAIGNKFEKDHRIQRNLVTLHQRKIQIKKSFEKKIKSVSLLEFTEAEDKPAATYYLEINRPAGEGYFKKVSFIFDQSLKKYVTVSPSSMQKGEDMLGLIHFSLENWTKKVDEELKLLQEFGDQKFIRPNLSLESLSSANSSSLPLLNASRERLVLDTLGLKYQKKHGDLGEKKGLWLGEFGGKDLETFFRKGEGLEFSEKERIVLFIKIIAKLKEFFKAGLVLHDLNSGNIVIRQEISSSTGKKTYQPYFIDLGQSYQLLEENQEGEKTFVASSAIKSIDPNHSSSLSPPQKNFRVHIDKGSPYIIVDSTRPKQAHWTKDSYLRSHFEQMVINESLMTLGHMYAKSFGQLNFYMHNYQGYGGSQFITQDAWEGMLLEKFLQLQKNYQANPHLPQITDKSIDFLKRLLKHKGKGMETFNNFYYD